MVLQSHEVRELLKTDGTRVDANSVALPVVGKAPGMLIGLSALIALVFSLRLSRKQLSGLLGLREVHYRFSQILLQIAKEAARWSREWWRSIRTGGGYPVFCACFRIWLDF